jgi:transposase
MFPWLATGRWKKWALHRYRIWRNSYQRAKRTAQMARLALQGVLTMAQVVDWLTASQLRYQLGALPVLYALLETLQVRQIVNRHCPGACDVDYGAVAIVLVLNRLMLPLPLYQIADWVGQTVLVSILGIPASKFNDDRLGRTLDALYPHLNAIWGDIVAVALHKTGVDLSVIFYDVTAFVTHGQHADSQLMDFGFAHNTPSNKRKLKLGLNAAADGNIPLLYQTWSGRTADQATVETNLNNLVAWLHKRGKQLQESLIVGIGPCSLLNSPCSTTSSDCAT